ncbi:MAG: oligopeptide/dipeptide ABC transporter ATP-binding protein [Candidatus Pelethousia sp.]|nr:oligopeptide/dipeptide ABC transporter ATP-binding protein [Candidatus Pelethousia sp.]
MEEMKKNIPTLEVVGLKKYFKTKNGFLHAVDDISFKIEEGQTLGVVGESGCGKSTLGRTILRLHQPTAGQVLFYGEDVALFDKRRMKQARSDMQIIFQDPYASLNPRMTVSQTIGYPLIVQGKFDAKDKGGVEKRVRELMDMVGLAQRLVNTYPHELDGGRRQRIGIARALALEPKFVVCDEPVSALDVSIQAQILNLMQDLQSQLGLTYMFITHNMSVVKHLSDQILVMYLGQMVEFCEAKQLFKNPLHPYTQALLSAIPVPDPDYKVERIMLEGEITSPINPAPGCRFAKRCKYATAKCLEGNIQTQEVEPGHFVACCKYCEQ